MGAAAAAQQQEARAVARNVVHGVGQHLEVVLGGSLLRGDRSPEAAAGHHPGGISCGAGGQLQGPRQVLGQPLGALGQGLGMGEHLTDPLQAAGAQQGMAHRQHQGMGNGEVGMLPEGIEAGGDPTLHGVLHRHHGGVTVALGQGLHHRPNPGLRHKFRLRESLQGHQLLGGLLGIGAAGTQKGNAHHNRQRDRSPAGRPIRSCRAGPQAMPLAFRASQQLQLGVRQEQQRLAGYLADEDRVVKALLDPSQLERLGPGHYRYAVSRLEVFQLKVQPVVDLRTQLQPGRLELVASDCQLEGLGLVEDFQLRLGSWLEAGDEGLEGEANLAVSVGQPQLLRLIPHKVLEATGRSILASILLGIKARVGQQLVADFESWCLEHQRLP